LKRCGADGGPWCSTTSRDPKEEQSFVSTLSAAASSRERSTKRPSRRRPATGRADRIAVSDMILMKMALTEVRSFPEIPVKVTMNEYIEIAKAYSTPKSKNFINGILDKLFAEMKSLLRRQWPPDPQGGYRGTSLAVES
jgi:hypothetical protein